MKKLWMSLVVCIVALVGGCSQPDGICPYMIKVDDKSYYCYDEIIEVSDVEVLGYITSCVGIKYEPEENGQANFPDCMEQPYGIADGQMLIYYAEDWHICYLVERDE